MCAARGGDSYDGRADRPAIWRAREERGFRLRWSLMGHRWCYMISVHECDHHTHTLRCSSWGASRVFLCRDRTRLPNVCAPRTPRCERGNKRCTDKHGHATLFPRPQTRQLSAATSTRAQPAPAHGRGSRCCFTVMADPRAAVEASASAWAALPCACSAADDGQRPSPCCVDLTPRVSKGCIVASLPRPVRGVFFCLVARARAARVVRFGRGPRTARARGVCATLDIPSCTLHAGTFTIHCASLCDPPHLFVLRKSKSSACLFFLKAPHSPVPPLSAAV